MFRKWLRVEGSRVGGFRIFSGFRVQDLGLQVFLDFVGPESYSLRDSGGRLEAALRPGKRNLGTWAERLEHGSGG